MNSQIEIKDLYFILSEDNPYKILNVAENTDIDTIARSFQQLCENYQPSNFNHLKGTEEYNNIEIIFGKIQSAFKTIKEKDELKRAELREKVEILIKEDEKRREQDARNEMFSTTEIRLDPSLRFFLEGKRNFDIDKIDKAIECFQKAIKEKGTDAAFHSYLGLSMLRKGWNGYAQAEFKIALNYDPNDSIALKYICKTVKPENNPKINNKIEKGIVESFFGKLFKK